MPYVYGDVFLAVNLLADAVILYAAGRLAGVRVRAGRVLLGAAAGSAYAFGYLFSSLSPLYSPLAKLAASLVFLGIAYAPLPLAAFLRLAAWLYAASACAAGLAAGLAWFGADTLLSGWVAGTLPIPWWLLGSVFLALALLVWRARDRVRPPLAGSPWHVPVQLVVGGRRLELTGLVDTGNLLRDPLSGRPVLVVEFDAVAPLIPPAARALYGAAGRGGAADAARLLAACRQEEWARRFRVLPFATVGNRHGLLWGFRPDLVVVGAAGEQRVWRGTTVAVTAERLAAEGGYQALVPPALLRPEGLAGVRAGAG